MLVIKYCYRKGPRYRELVVDGFEIDMDMDMDDVMCRYSVHPYPDPNEEDETCAYPCLQAAQELIAESQRHRVQYEAGFVVVAGLGCDVYCAKLRKGGEFEGEVLYN